MMNVRQATARWEMLLVFVSVGAFVDGTAGGDLAATSGSQPPFAIRGTLPWHNFLSGPTAWNEADYRAYLDDLKAQGLNFVGFHCYTGGAERYAPYVEPMIRLKYRDVLPQAGFDTSLTARWGYRPLAVQGFRVRHRQAVSRQRRVRRRVRRPRRARTRIATARPRH